MEISAKERLIVALDVPGIPEAESLMDSLGQAVNYYKVGSQLFTACGPRIVESVKQRGHRIFLDLKFHDIPNTVAQAARSACRMGVDMMNLHAMGGFSMMEMAASALANEAAGSRPLLLGVTVLTSIDEATFQDVLGAPGRSIEEQVLHLADLSRSAGLDGVVASPREIVMLRQAMGKDFVILTPGIRPSDSPSDDQKRFMTPGQAIAAGADYLVVGRPVTGAKNPAESARRIIEEMSDVIK
jgi:orotidine-5'-phosphate decarboxylase